MTATIPLHSPQNADIWARLAAPVDASAIAWRQDGKVISRDGKHFARFVAYIEANTVRERLDAVVPGEWDLTLELLPPVPESSEEPSATPCAFKARLKVLNVIREDVGSGRDYKSASTDAFKRAGVRFGIAHELYGYEHNWCPMDGDGRNAKPLENPGVVYARKHGAKVHNATGGNDGMREVQGGTQRASGNGTGSHMQSTGAIPVQGERGTGMLDVDRVDERTVRGVTPKQQAQGVRTSTVVAAGELQADTERSSGSAQARQSDVRESGSSVRDVASGQSRGHETKGAGEKAKEVVCPKCGGPTWDNRLTKRSPKAPDFKCKDRQCEGVIWPPRAPGAKPKANGDDTGDAFNDEPPPYDADIPF